MSIIKKKIIWRLLRIAIQIIATSPVLLETLYAIFLAQSDKQSFNLFMHGDVDEHDDPKWIKLGSWMIIIILGITNALSDTFAIDIPRRTFEFINKLKNFSKKELLSISTFLTIGITLVAFFFVYFVRSAADAIPVDEKIEDKDHSLIRSLLAYTALVIISGLGAIYYLLFNTNKIHKHFSALKNFLKNLNLLKKDFLKRFFLITEVLIENTLNGIYRGVSSAYILKVILNTVFKLRSGALFYILLSLAGGIAFLLTYLTRFLYAYEYFADERFKILTWQEIFTELKPGLPYAKNILGIINDYALSIIRGGGITMLIGLLTSSVLPKFISYTLGSAVGVPLSLLSLGTRLYARACHNALESLGPNEIARRMGKSIPDIARDINSITMNNDLTEEQKKEKIFNAIAESFHSHLLSSGILIVNVGSRIARFLTFFPFVYQLFQVFGIDLSVEMLLALSFIPGDVAGNDLHTYQASILETITSIFARVAIEKYLYRERTEENIVLLEDEDVPTYSEEGAAADNNTIQTARLKHASHALTKTTASLFHYGAAITVKAPQDYSLDAIGNTYQPSRIEI